MIKILSRKAFRFKDPNVQILDGQGGVSQPDFGSAFFDTTPNQIQNAPEWIKTDLMWKWAVKDGDLMEITVQSDEVAHAELKPKLTNADEVAAAAELERTRLVSTGTPTNLPPDLKSQVDDAPVDSTAPADATPAADAPDTKSVGAPAARSRNRRVVTSND